MTTYRIRIDADRCKGCELCIAFCPRHSLAMSTSLNATGAHFPERVSAHDCTGCRQCAVICPDAAIEIEKGIKVRDVAPEPLSKQRAKKN